MFRGAISPHRYPPLEDQQQPETPSKKSFHNMFFGKGEEPEQHDADDREEVSTTKSAIVSAFSGEAATSNRNPRDTFQRANSHPIRLDASAALSASHGFDPSMTRAAALEVSSYQFQSQRPGGQKARDNQVPSGPPSLRGTVFGSGSLVLSTVISELFQAINTSNQCIGASISHEEPLSIATDKNTARKAKLVYISLLEKAQKESGEWRGFSSPSSKIRQENNGPDEQKQEVHDDSIAGLLRSSLTNTTKEEMFMILNDLLDLSFKNLRVALVTPAMYSKHKQSLSEESLACPTSFDTLVLIRRFIGEMSQIERMCLLRLLSLWGTLCIVEPNTELTKFAEKSHSLIFSECSEMEFMQQAARKSVRPDPVAIDLLIVMAHYRDLLYSDIEFFKIRQEMHFSPPDAEPIEQVKCCSDCGIQVSLDEAPVLGIETKGSGCVEEWREALSPPSESKEDQQRAESLPVGSRDDSVATDELTLDAPDDIIPMAVAVILDDGSPIARPSGGLLPSSSAQNSSHGSIMAVPLPHVAQRRALRTKRRAMGRRPCDSDRKQAITAVRDKSATPAAVSRRAIQLPQALAAAVCIPHHDGAMGPHREPTVATLATVSVVAASFGALVAFLAARRRNP